VLPNTALRQALTGRRSHPARGDGEGIEEEIHRRNSRRVTISVGVSMLKPGDDTDSLIERAMPALRRQAQRPQSRRLRADPEYAAETQSQVA